ncbi:hypothetical protein CJD38_14635 [Stenotrophobium rhamnosiphilum]|uniref:Uncharacterized protein n=1 Tax=Stenotrophobium rhamnosiphilum TaxID=2029166 RepID=A0A2T5MDT7_9GAMM|nr:hypothetical protein CJD38_14635 [Stenotrophobium rhamnosiphilum]
MDAQERDSLIKHRPVLKAAQERDWWEPKWHHLMAAQERPFPASAYSKDHPEATANGIFNRRPKNKKGEAKASPFMHHKANT